MDRVSQKATSALREKGSRLTVVVPTCNRLPDLSRWLRSIESAWQAVPGQEVEILVTDDGRQESAEAMIQRDFRWVIWTEGPAKGPAANRNHGARQVPANGSFIDDDCVADPGWIQPLRARGTDRDLDVIEGQSIIPDKKDDPYMHGGKNLTCNLAVRREPFLEICGFDEECLETDGEDMKFAWRIKRALKAVFLPEALVLSRQRSYSLRTFLARIPLLKWSLLYYQESRPIPPKSSPALVVA